MTPRPIEVSPVHFRIQDRCMGAFVVDVIAEDPLDPEFLLDLVVMQPRRRVKDRFVDNGSTPGVWRWVNNVTHAPVTEKAEKTWHYPGRDCLPEVVLRGAV
jgi:hypothetical protein